MKLAQTITLPAANGWTGGQYSVFRMLLAVAMLWHIAVIGYRIWATANQPWPYMAVLLGGGLALMLLVGWQDRVAALGLIALNHTTALPSGGGVYTGLLTALLVLHALTPSAPFGSLTARGRVDPAGDWQLPQPIYQSVWLLVSFIYLLDGFSKLAMVDSGWLDGTALAQMGQLVREAGHPLGWLLTLIPEMISRPLTWLVLAAELSFLPLALFARTRPIIWTLMLAVHVLFLIFTLGIPWLMLLHLLAFNPAWLKPRPADAPELLFYDGNCGLCHRWVRFVLAEDRGGDAFTFAPLGSQAMHQAICENQRHSLPDSIVVQKADQTLLVRSDAALHILARLGGLWRVLSWIGRLVPRLIRSRAYDVVAAFRHKLFAKPPDACPMLPPELRARFRY